MVPCFPPLDSLASVDLLTDSGYTCSACDPQRFDSQAEKLSCHASGTRKLLNTFFTKMMQQQKKPWLVQG